MQARCCRLEVVANPYRTSYLPYPSQGNGSECGIHLQRKHRYERVLAPVNLMLSELKIHCQGKEKCLTASSRRLTFQFGILPTRSPSMTALNPVRRLAMR